VNVLIIDSGSRSWQELLEEIDALAQTKYRGNSWSAWREGTPKQRKFINALLAYPGHIIFTIRSKTDWLIETDDKGRGKPVKVGMAPEQGKGIEYEFDMLMEITHDHVATVTKDRTGKYQDAIIRKPGIDMGADIIRWLLEAPDTSKPAPHSDPDTSEGTTYLTVEQYKQFIQERALMLFDDDRKAAAMHVKSMVGDKKLAELPVERLAEILNMLNNQLAEKKGEAA